MRPVARTLTVLLVIAVAFGAAAALWQSWRSAPSSSAPNQQGWVSTKYGPLGPADRDLVIKVRQAGLWEMPVGQQMEQRATQQKVRDIGTKISNEHIELDAKTRAIATELGIVLPNQPSDQQQGWLREINAQAGDRYDETAVNRLRQAHGIVLPLLIAVRVGTRNAAVRAFADDAATYVTRHINYLESTGLVDFDALPEPPTPPPATVTSTGEYRQVPVALVALGIVLAAAVLIVLVLRVLPRRRSSAVRPSRHLGTRPRARGPAPPGFDPARPDDAQETDMIRSPR